MKSKTIIIMITFSIVLLYIAATVSIILISRKEEEGALTDKNTDTNSPPTTTDKETNIAPPVTTDKYTIPPEPQKPPKTKKVAFTFDDGPHYELTYKFVDELKRYNGGATFFVVGNRIGDRTGKAIKYAHDNGCQIQIHAFTHEVYFDKCTYDEYCSEIDRTGKAIKMYVNSNLKYMRPPGGRISDYNLAVCKYSVIMWSVDSNDWKYKGTGSERQQNINTIVNNVLSNVSDGDIVLMHEIYENSYEAFCIIARELDKQGYEFVTIEELLGDSLQVGKVYTKAKAA